MTHWVQDSAPWLVILEWPLLRVLLAGSSGHVVGLQTVRPPMLPVSTGLPRRTPIRAKLGHCTRHKANKIRNDACASAVAMPFTSESPAALDLEAMD